MNLGTVGFLLNQYSAAACRAARKARAGQPDAAAHARHQRARQRHEAIAINEVSLLRSSRQTARIAVSVDGRSACPTSIATAPGGDAGRLDRPTTCRPTARSCRSAPACWR
jgi:hypothetical protein